jgi:hypothetical protein
MDRQSISAASAGEQGNDLPPRCDRLIDPRWALEAWTDSGEAHIIAYRASEEWDLRLAKAGATMGTGDLF